MEDTALIKDTILMLRREIPAESGALIGVDEAMAAEMAALLHQFNIARTRKMAILGGYMLMKLAFARHREATHDDGEALTRCILDGDYFFGLYFRLMAKYSELQLLALLAPMQKKIQIGALQGQSIELLQVEVMDIIRSFLKEQCGGGGDSDEAA